MSVASIAELLDVAPVSSGATRRPFEPLAATMQSAAVRLRLRVVWGDLARVPADIHVAGHYQGVLPASAELALDDAISTPRGILAPARSTRGIIAEHTRRRWLIGELGEISYFPGRQGDPAASPIRCVAVAGMGRMGTFSESRAEQLYASLLRELGSLTDVKIAALNLIGTGAENLTIEQATGSLHRGFRGVLAGSREGAALREIILVERDRLRAEQVAVILKDLTRESTSLVAPAGVEHGEGGDVDQESAAVFTIRAIANMLRRRHDGDGLPDSSPAGTRNDLGAMRDLFSALRDHLPAGIEDEIPRKLESLADSALRSISVSVAPSALRPDHNLFAQAGTPSRLVPNRISVSLEGGRMRWAALTERSTVPERQVNVNSKLVSELIQRLTAPDPADAARLPRMIREWIVPGDLHHHIDETSPLVLEVDSASAQLPWEFLTDRPYDLNERPRPLALRTPIARQLRTSYARTVADYGEPACLRALIVADPGPPEKSLGGAREEGIELAKLFGDRGVDVTLFVGPPGTAPPDEARVAGQLDVLTELLVGRYDIVHFAGHGTMPGSAEEEVGRPRQAGWTQGVPGAETPRIWKAGWLFADDVLTARELTQMTWAPRIVTANACWTAAAVGSPGARGDQSASTLDDIAAKARLTAVLADEFLRVGVAHYVGTSWRVPSEMARKFMTSFYDSLLPRDGQRGQPLGEALRRSREVIFAERGTTPDHVLPEMWSAWAAYQHYGDPTDVLDAFDPSPVMPSVETSAQPASPARSRRASSTSRKPRRKP